LKPREFESFLTAFLSTSDVLLLEANQLTGTANTICLSKPINVTYFASDCGGSEPALECSCCTVCCEGKDSCNDLDWDDNLDPKWEADYKMNKYEFGLGVNFLND
jgi:hypothetical protein